MTKTTMSSQIDEYIEAQLAVWPMAAENYRRLGQTERRMFTLGDLRVAVQHNPARIRSTGAAVDKESVARRPCFLCEDNRPVEQVSPELISGWSILVNPYPIFPVHFTIVSNEHIPQAEIPLEMAAMAEKLPGLAVFFNGSRAGASAPDHLHCQAVLKDELPLLRLVEERHGLAMEARQTASSLGLDVPFDFVSMVIRPDLEGMSLLADIPNICGHDAETGEEDKGLVNAFFWMDSNLLRVVVIPRRAHRPSAYFEEEPERLIVSPGAIDMAGVIVTPRREDFEKITAGDIRRIYAEVGSPLS